MKKLIIVIVPILILVVVSLLLIMKEGLSITIKESEIQSAVYKKFPMEMTHLLILKVEYTNPIVEVMDNKDRIRIGFTLSPLVEVNGKRHSGSVVVNGGFRYDPTLGKVFLTGFEVEKLQLDGYKSVQLDKITGAISLTLEGVYSKHAVYTLKDDIKQKTAKMVVRKVTIRNKAVTIDLGL